ERGSPLYYSALSPASSKQPSVQAKAAISLRTDRMAAAVAIPVQLGSPAKWSIPAAIQNSSANETSKRACAGLQRDDTNTRSPAATTASAALSTVALMGE